MDQLTGRVSILTLIATGPLFWYLIAPVTWLGWVGVIVSAVAAWAITVELTSRFVYAYQARRRPDLGRESLIARAHVCVTAVQEVLRSGESLLSLQPFLEDNAIRQLNLLSPTDQQSLASVTFPSATVSSLSLRDSDASVELASMPLRVGDPVVTCEFTLVYSAPVRVSELSVKVEGGRRQE